MIKGTFQRTPYNYTDPFTITFSSLAEAAEYSVRGGQNYRQWGTISIESGSGYEYAVLNNDGSLHMRPLVPNGGRLHKSAAWEQAEKVAEELFSKPKLNI